MLIPVFGEQKELPDEDDLFFLVDKTNYNSIKPRIYIGVGTEDFLYESNVRLKEKFEQSDYDFTYRESSGTHNWEFWDEYIKYALEWMFDN